MDAEKKTRFFDLLVKVGLKEIEVGFPSAGATEFDFIAGLVRGDRIPDDVTIQVLTQSRRDLIETSFASLDGARSRDRPPLQRGQPGVAPDRVRHDARRGQADRGRRRQGPARRGRQAARTPTGSSNTAPRPSPPPSSISRLEVCEAVMDVLRPTPDAPDHPQPARDRRVRDAQRLCRPDRMVRPPHPQPRQRGDLAPHPQRPRHRRRRGRARADGGRRPGRGLPARQRRAHRQLRSRDGRAQHVHARRRSRPRPVGHRRGREDGRILHQHPRPPAHALCRRPRLHRLLGLAPGRDQEGLRRAASAATTSIGRCPTCRSTPPTSAAATRR